MSDLIERDMLKKALTSLAVCSSKSHAKAYARCINIVERMPSACVEPENRVLTLEELKHYRGYAWLETWDGELGDWPLWLDGEGYSVTELGWSKEFESEEEFEKYAARYNKKGRFRFWLMPPTQEERKNTLWEE